MPKISLLIGLLIAAIVVVGGIFLSTWDIPAPDNDIEIVISNDRFPT